MIAMIELPDMPPESADLATARFTELGLPSSRMIGVPFEGGTWRYFAVYQMPTLVDDCKFMIADGEPVAVFHGTGCNMVRRIHKDIHYGRQSDFQYCRRRLAGGVFATVDITTVLAHRKELNRLAGQLLADTPTDTDACQVCGQLLDPLDDDTAAVYGLCTSCWDATGPTPQPRNKRKKRA